MLSRSTWRGLGITGSVGVLTSDTNQRGLLDQGTSITQSH
jgi:hypothetical protein